MLRIVLTRAVSCRIIKISNNGGGEYMPTASGEVEGCGSCGAETRDDVARPCGISANRMYECGRRMPAAAKIKISLAHYFGITRLGSFLA